MENIIRALIVALLKLSARYGLDPNKVAREAWKQFAEGALKA
jgi:hypothetical protein